MKPAETAILPFYAAQEIAKEIGEPGRSLKYITRIVTEIGAVKAAQYVVKAKELHKTGTILTNDGTRQRSLAGIFFYLVRQETTHQRK